MTNLIQKASEIKSVVHASLSTLVSSEFKAAYTKYSQSVKKALTERNKAITKAKKQCHKAIMRSASKFNSKTKTIYATKKQELAMKQIKCRKVLSKRPCGCC